MNRKFDWNDISLIPTIISNIKSRKEINILDKNGKLPLFVSPMDTVIDENNYNIFRELGFYVCIPRGLSHLKFEDDCFISFGLDELEEIFETGSNIPKRILIDVANGHSIRVVEMAKKIKDTYPHVELMVGNIANPLTYKVYAEIGVDYVRTGIGSGMACTTSANASIHYPMASLIQEINEIKKEGSYRTKIVADGGFRKYDDIIKAIGLGADYVMLGNIINKSIESCGQNYLKEGEKYIEIDKEMTMDHFKNGEDVYKMFRGMSTKEVQKIWGKKELRTSEGIVKFNKVDYSIAGWVDNFKDYLKSAMSYQGEHDIKNFTGNAEYVFITENAFNRFNK